MNETAENLGPLLDTAFYGLDRAEEALRAVVAQVGIEERTAAATLWDDARALRNGIRGLTARVRR